MTGAPIVYSVDYPVAAAAAPAISEADTLAISELWASVVVEILAEEVADKREVTDLGTVLWSFSAFRYYAQIFRGMQAEAAKCAVNLQMSAAALRKYAIEMATSGRARGRSDPRALSECMVTAACGGTCTLTTPFLSLVHTEDYHTVVVWERAPLAPEDGSLMRVYLEMALDLSRPLCIMGNVCGVRELTRGSGGSGGSWSWSGSDSDEMTSLFSGDCAPPPEPDVTTDLFLLVHAADVARFMTQRATGMGMRFYEELIAEGKRFSVIPNKSFSRTPWGVPKN